jgi:hypothetical protein
VWWESERAEHRLSGLPVNGGFYFFVDFFVELSISAVAERPACGRTIPPTKKPTREKTCDSWS